MPGAEVDSSGEDSTFLGPAGLLGSVVPLSKDWKIRRGFLLRRSGLSFIAVIAVLGGVLTVGVRSGVAGKPTAPPIGDRHGIALLARIHAAYRRVPALELVVTRREGTPGRFGHFLIRLHHGTTTAEEFIRPRPAPTTLLARLDGPTYARDASRRCWRRLPSSDPRTLNNAGIAFPYERKEKVAPPRRVGHSWILKIEDPNDYWFLATQTRYRPTPKRIITYTIDAKSDRIRAIQIQALKGYAKGQGPHTSHPKLVWLTATLRPITLSARPAIPKPLPPCR